MPARWTTVCSCSWVRAADEERAAVGTAEPAREREPVGHRHRVGDAAALLDPPALPGRERGDPHRAVGAEGDAVGPGAVGERRPHPPVVERPVGRDRERREPVGQALGHDQRPAVGRHRHPVGERERLPHRSTRPVGLHEGERHVGPGLDRRTKSLP